MKKTITLIKLCILFIFLGTQLSAQNVGISNSGNITPHSSALLDLVSTDKGLSIPNVSLVATNDVLVPILNPKVGLIVFNNATVTGTHGVTPGFYYFAHNNLWTKLGSVEAIPGTKIYSDIVDPIISPQYKAGDFYIKKTTNTAVLFGPYTGTSWPTNSVSLVGKSVLSGIVDPTSLTDGIEGDYYMRADAIPATTYTLYGPKTSTGFPATGVPIVTGKNGNTIHTGNNTTNINAIGGDGDYFMDISNPNSYVFYGPKVNGAFPSVGLKLVGINNVWNTTGNTGTIRDVNFLGTTDSQDFALRTNNTERIVVDKSTGNVAIGQAAADSQVILDLTNTNNKAVSFPNAALTHTNANVNAMPFTLPLKPGMLVYNTATNYSAGIAPGFYYAISDAAWAPITSGIQSGPAGPAGSQGIGFLTSSNPMLPSPPTSAVGVEGEYYFDRATKELYGPKIIDGTQPQNGGWGVPISTLGIGPDGKGVRNGISNPVFNTNAKVGDFYINTTDKTLWGPAYQIAFGLAWGTVPIATLQGTTAKSILSGITAPTIEGKAGDFYFNTVTKEFYGPKTTAWSAPITTLQSTGWGLAGNTAITPTNFIGSINAADVIFKTANTEAMRINANGNISIGSPVAHLTAILDITSTNKGLSIPNVILTATNSQAPFTQKPKNGLLVYNLNSVGTPSITGISPGMYYWEGNIWKTFGTGPGVGAQGSPGKPGTRIFRPLDSATPTLAEGVEGDFCIISDGLPSATTVSLIGPKLASTGWVGTNTTIISGPKGDIGVQGVTGLATKIYISETPPNPYANGTGRDGDFYIYNKVVGTTTTSFLYGPKDLGRWGNDNDAVSLNGPKGDRGATVISGTLNPLNNIIPGIQNGDYYIYTTTIVVSGKNGTVQGQSAKMFGPFVGQWPNTSVELVGLQGFEGNKGSQIYKGLVAPSAAAIPNSIKGDYYLQVTGVFGSPGYSVVLHGPKVSDLNWPSDAEGINLMGEKGDAGTKIYNGSIKPIGANTPGKEGDYYLEASGTGTNAIATLWGPREVINYATTKTLNLIGAQGKPGLSGSRGNIILTSNLTPSNPDFTSLVPSSYTTGDFYLQRSNIGTPNLEMLLYGPFNPTVGVTLAEKWGTPVSLLGKRGTAILNGSADPIGSAILNAKEGDYYIRTQGNPANNTHTVHMYGPAGVGGNFATSTPTPLQGYNGKNANVILSGNGVPGAIGVIGDFYLDKINSALWGPKDVTGVWSPSISIIGTSGSENAWSLLGTSNINSNTNYLGTSDNQPLVVKTNAIQRMKVSGLTGNILLGDGSRDAYTSAVLDMSDINNRGILFPQIALTSNTMTTGFAGSIPPGLMIYNTALVNTPPANSVTPGYYYYNGTTWNIFGSGSGGTGPRGNNGLPGYSIRSGVAAPSNTDNINVGDFWLNTTNYILFGPIADVNNPTVGTKTISLIGPAGKSILSGITVPSALTGTIGDFYINTSTSILYGPKGSSDWVTAGTTFTYNLGERGTIPTGSSAFIVSNDGYIPLMNQQIFLNNLGYFEAKASDGDGTAVNAFDNDPQTFWSANYNPTSSVKEIYLQIKLPVPIAVNRVEISSYMSHAADFSKVISAATFSFQGSNDANGPFTTLYLASNITTGTSPNNFIVNSTVPYRFYRIAFMSNFLASSTAGLSRFQIYENANKANDLWYIDKANALIGLKINSQEVVRPESVSFIIKDNGNIGIGNLNPTGELQLSNANRTKKLVLWDNAPSGNYDSHNFTGFGVNDGSLRYQVASTANDHIFYAGNENGITSKEIMRIKGNGLIGVNNPVPTGSFQVGSDAFIVTTDNKVGIGTTTVASNYRAQVNGTLAADWFVTTKPTNGLTTENGWQSTYGGGFFMKEESPVNYIRVYGNKPILSNSVIISQSLAAGYDAVPEITNPDIKLFVNGKAYVNTALGIGISDPLFPLHVNGQGRTTKLGVGTNPANDNTSLMVNGKSFFNGNVGILTKPLSFQLEVAGNSNITQTLTIAGNEIVSGNLSVGTIDATHRLNVDGNAYIKDRLSINTTPDPNYILNVNGAGNFEGNVIANGWFVSTNATGWKTEDGKKQITTDGNWINVNPGIRTPKLYATDGITVGGGNYTSDAMLYVNGNIKCTEISGTSDIRFKKDIQDIVGALDKVLLLQGHTYEWKIEEFKDKNFTKGKQYGFIAQELEKVLPELVSTGSDGYKSVNYANITAVLAEAIKDLSKGNTTLKAQIGKNHEDVTKKLESLKAELKKINSITTQK